MQILLGELQVGKTVEVFQIIQEIKFLFYIEKMIIKWFILEFIFMGNSQNKLVNGNKLYECCNIVIQKENNSYENNLNEVNQRSNYNCKENKYLKNDNLIKNNEISNINSSSWNNDFEQNIIQIMLKNVGNTTYMNSRIRCFANNKFFSDYFLYNLNIFKNNSI